MHRLDVVKGNRRVIEEHVQHPELVQVVLLGAWRFRGEHVLHVAFGRVAERDSLSGGRRAVQLGPLPDGLGVILADRFFSTLAVLNYLDVVMRPGRAIQILGRLPAHVTLRLIFEALRVSSAVLRPALVRALQPLCRQLWLWISPRPVPPWPRTKKSE